MSDREDRLRSLLEKVRAKRPDEHGAHAAEALDRIRTASGTTTAAAQPSPPIPPAVQPTPVPPAARPTPAPPAPERRSTPGLDSPTLYSSQPPGVERPLSIERKGRSSARPSAGPASAPPAPRRPEPIRPQSVAPTGQPVVYSTDQPEFPRPKTFGDLLELTLSLRPR